MADDVIKLSEISDPVFKFEFPEGKINELDPFEVLERVDADVKVEGSVFDHIRAAFKLPTEKGPLAGTPVLSRHKCLNLVAALRDFVEKLEVSKKLAVHSRKSPGSTESNRANGGD